MPGCRDIVQHEVNGLLVPPRDNGSLERALESLILDAGMRARYGAASRRIAEQYFALPGVLDRIWSLYVRAGLIEKSP
jgi:glycosyltransferase involved in cell wall biosynthesis